MAASQQQDSLVTVLHLIFIYPKLINYRPSFLRQTHMPGFNVFLRKRFMALNSNAAYRFIFPVLFLLFFCSCKFREKVSLVVHHARIYTVDEKFSTAEAMAIRDGKILEVGNNDDILKKYEGEETINA